MTQKRRKKGRPRESFYYEEVFRELNRRKVRYLIAGGIAVNLHGAPRFTADLDLVVQLERANVLRFVKAMKMAGYLPKVPVDAAAFGDPATRERWIEEKGMRVFSFYHPREPFRVVDVFVREPVDFNAAYSRRLVQSVGRFKVDVLSIDDLIKTKEAAGRAQDVSDILTLRRLKELRNEK